MVFLAQEVLQQEEVYEWCIQWRSFLTVRRESSPTGAIGLCCKKEEMTYDGSHLLFPLSLGWAMFLCDAVQDPKPEKEDLFIQSMHQFGELIKK